MAPKSRREFEVAIICALPLEADAVEASFDETYDSNNYGKHHTDTNEYSTGRIAHHHVVLVHMPGMGKVSAASVAAKLTSSFPAIRLALVVGICGGVPFIKGRKEVILGDVIISDGIVQYDLGRQLPDRFIKKDTIKDSLGRPNIELRGFLAKIQTWRSLKSLQSRLLDHLEMIHDGLDGISVYPGASNDRLFEASYQHKHRQTACEICGSDLNDTDSESACDAALLSSCESIGCSMEKLYSRRRLTNAGEKGPHPYIHIGLMGSADTVLKSANHRDEIAQREDVIAFEMESAGIWDTFSCLVIKGVCDYSDSHKDKDWQRYAAATAAACSKALLEKWNSRSARSPPPSELIASPSKPLFSVPFHQDPDFVGREEIIANIWTQFEKKSRVALVGLGGIGKSQIAIEFCYRFRKHHPTAHVLWVHCSSRQRIEDGFRQIACEALLPGFDDPKTDSLQLVLRWLGNDSSKRWLLVLDNADKLDVVTATSSSGSGPAEPQLAQYLPQSLYGAILVTSRDENVGRQLVGRARIKVSPMDLIESTRFLELHLEQRNSSHQDIEAFVEALCHIPLAMKMAIAYVNTMRIYLSDYLRLFHGGKMEMQKLLDHMDHDERRDRESLHSISQTWIVSFNYISTHNPRAADLLSMMAMFDQHGIPKVLLQKTEPETSYLGAIQMLISFSLITVNADVSRSHETYDIHRLVRLSVHKWLKTQKMQEEYGRKALESMTSHFPWPSYDDLDSCSVLLPHAIVVTQYIYRENDNRTTLSRLHGCLGEYFVKRGRYDSAIEHFLKSHEYDKEIEGLMHPDSLGSMNNIGNALRNLGKYEEAEEMHRQCLDLRKNVLGPKHPDTLMSMNNLGAALSSQGKHEEAEEMHRHCLELRITGSGVAHPETLRVTVNLGNVLASLRRYEEAQSLLERALASLQQVFGSRHRLTSLSEDYLNKVIRLRSEAEQCNALEGLSSLLREDSNEDSSSDEGGARID